MSKDFTKEFFQQAWGEDGYYEHFSYGVGIDKVCEVCVYPFLGEHKCVLEIGSGGGVFTENIIPKAGLVTAIDVIKYPIQYDVFPASFGYIELHNKDYTCAGVLNDSIDFAFSYNTFCHLSNDALKEYLKSVHRVLVEGGDFVFMLSDFNQIKQHVPDPDKYKLGDLLPMGHFYQDERTLDLIADPSDWEIVSRSMIPEHRDIIIHLKKK